MSCAIFPPNILHRYILNSRTVLDLLNCRLFCKNAKKTILLLKRALGIPYVNRIEVFDFCVYKNVSQKNSFLYMNENYDDCHHRKITRKFIYRKIKKTCQTFIYTKKPDIFQKARQFPLRFYIKTHTVLLIEMPHFQYIYYSSTIMGAI